MPKSGSRANTRAYSLAKRRVERVLYDVDPLGFGSSVGSPPDEYSEEAARLIPILLAIHRGDLRQTLDTVLPPSVDANLVRQLLEAIGPMVGNRAMSPEILEESLKGPSSNVRR